MAMKRRQHDLKIGLIVLFCTCVAIGATALSGAISAAGAATRMRVTGKAATTNFALPPEGSRYVSLGSSLASGFGIQAQLDCGRSSNNYARIVARKLRLTLSDVSCANATIPDVLDKYEYGDIQPQIHAVAPSTRLITVGLGGNDINYNAFAVKCGLFSMCSHPTDTASLEAALPGRLNKMLAALKAAAPSAEIVVVTYPLEFGATDCAALAMPTAAFAILQKMGSVLEWDLVNAAHRAHVRLADPYSSPPVHTACGPGAHWTAGLNPTNSFPYHPTELGHQVMAKMILAALHKAVS
jgi:lysophospholipase L1-like esterase